VNAELDQLHPRKIGSTATTKPTREVCGLNGAGIDPIGGKSGAEDLGATFAAEKDDAFIENRKPGNFSGPVDERESLALYPVKVSEIDGIVALIKGDLLDIYRDI
jgi:hypothetical protein